MLWVCLLIAIALLVVIVIPYLLFRQSPKRRPLLQALPKLHDLPVYWLENIISDEENAHLRELAKDKLKRSYVEGDRIVPQRTSSSAIIPDDDVVKRIKQRLAQLCNYPVKKFEPLQVVKYEKGQEYRPHHDYLTGWQHSHRHVTFFIYLDEVKDGGETEFVQLGLVVKPKRNCALLWYNVTEQGKLDPRTLHAGKPPSEGEKWGVNVWVHG